MGLADDIRKLGASASAEIDAALDYHFQSIAIWERVKSGVPLSVQNKVNGRIADHSEIVSLSTEYLRRYLTPATFQQLITIFESFYFDLLSLWLATHPGILLRKQVELETVLAAPDTTTVLQSVIDRELNEVKYRKVGDWFEYLRKLVAVPGPSNDEIATLAEAKASRDIIVHNKSIVNAVYVAKAGTKARYVAGDILELPDPYLHATSELLAKVIEGVAVSVAAKA